MLKKWHLTLHLWLQKLESLGQFLTGVYHLAFGFHKKVKGSYFDNNKRTLYTRIKLKGLAWGPNNAVTSSKETDVVITKDWLQKVHQINTAL